ncbi:uncharacterized protein LOC133896102 [Phragmites australis]|uniref:uncharacterized protein LOC133896102 n=1 Tax=Phragmites australis TaxID=29695 RepID=UPI002D795E4C|nr:uncharacterized protein LOC133896102 [Phragmites australis]
MAGVRKCSSTKLQVTEEKLMRSEDENMFLRECLDINEEKMSHMAQEVAQLKQIIALGQYRQDINSNVDGRSNSPRPDLRQSRHNVGNYHTRASDSPMTASGQIRHHVGSNNNRQSNSHIEDLRCESDESVSCADGNNFTHNKMIRRNITEHNNIPQARDDEVL